MVEFQIQSNGINFFIDISILQNIIAIKGTSNYNNNFYYLELNLKYLHNKYIFFQRCNSLNEAFQLLIISFKEKGYVKDINNLNLLLGIKNEEEILFNLERYDLNNNRVLNNRYDGVNNIFAQLQINQINNSKNNYSINNLNNNNNLYLNNNINNNNNNFNNLNNNNINNDINNISNLNNINNNNNFNNTNIIGNFNKDNNINNHFNDNDNNNNFNNKINDKFFKNCNNQNQSFNNYSDNLNNKINNNNMNNINNFNPESSQIELTDENFPLISIKILQENNNLNNAKDLSGLLKVCLLKKLSEKFENFDKIKENLDQHYQNIFKKFLNNIHFTGINNNIETMIKENKILNIWVYSQYLNNQIIDSKTINSLINKFLNSEQKKEIGKYWQNLSSYILYNTFFESEFIHHLKICKFDYSLISFNILENDNYEEYEKKKKECPNMCRKIVYQSSKISPFLNILSDKLEYSKRTLYGKGFYFSDMIDFIPTYLDKEKNNSEYGKIIPVNKTFSFIASEIFYEEKKLNSIEYIQYPNMSIQESNDVYYSNKNVEPNGINHISISIKKRNSKKIQFIGNEYVISENYQIFPLYTITLKRNEYCVLWRDPNFELNNSFKEFLEKVKKVCREKINMNLYYESSTEKALNFLIRRRHDKIILITSIGKDFSGKRFIEIARKIFGFEIMILFFSKNREHLEWIQRFPNCLYTNKYSIFEEYITNFNEDGLQNLKKKVEETYQIKLMRFTFDFLLYPNYKNNGDFSSLDTNNDYLKNVYIKNDKSNGYLSMTIEGNVIIEDKKCPWALTFLNNEITAFSNGFYLCLKNKEEEKVSGFLFMKKWYFDKIGEKYYFINPEKEKNNILSIEGDIVKVNKENAGENELFQLIDI